MSMTWWQGGRSCSSVRAMLQARNRCDVGQPRNRASRAVHCLLGHEGTPPTELLATGRCELQRYSTAESHTDRVTGITPTGNQFAVACADGFALTARKVLLTGLTDEVPQIEGIDQLYAEAFTIALTAKQTLASRNGLPLSSWLTFQINGQARGDAGEAFEGRVEIEIADAIAERPDLGGG